MIITQLGKKFPAFFGAQTLKMSTLASQNELSQQIQTLHL